MNRLYSSALFVILFSSACSSGGTANGGSTGPISPLGAATVSGLVDGISLHPVSAIAHSYSQGANGVWVVSVDIGDGAANCTASTQNKPSLGLYVETDPPATGLTASPAGPGTYPIPIRSGGLAGGGFSAGTGGYSTVQSGDITLTQVTPSLVEGSFSVLFTSSSTPVTGTFSAPLCPGE